MTRRVSRRPLRRWFAGAIAIVFTYFGYVYLMLPDVRQLATANPPTTAFMELRAREAKAQGKEPRRVQRWVSYRRISPNLTRAVLVAEDAAFWRHEGVDYDELQKSIELDLARGQLLRGASTITQQLAKNLYLSPSRNPVRKLRELIIARRLEAALQKARILELYLNVIEWGDGIYGVEAAARTYFGTSASALGPRESALLAGAIINPRLLNPAKPTARLVRRQQLILSRMGGVTPPVEPPRGLRDLSPPPVDSVPPAGSPPPFLPGTEPAEPPPSRQQSSLRDRRPEKRAAQLDLPNSVRYSRSAPESLAKIDRPAVASALSTRRDSTCTRAGQTWSSRANA